MFSYYDFHPKPCVKSSPQRCWDGRVFSHSQWTPSCSLAAKPRLVHHFPQAHGRDRDCRLPSAPPSLPAAFRSLIHLSTLIWAGSYIMVSFLLDGYIVHVSTPATPAPQSPYLFQLSHHQRFFSHLLIRAEQLPSWNDSCPSTDIPGAQSPCIEVAYCASRENDFSLCFSLSRSYIP